MGGDVWACDNCGKLITNIVTVTDSTGKTYMIGTDCADTLVKAKCLYQSGDRDYVTDNYTLKACARFVTEVNAGVKMQIEGPQVFITDRKGRQVMEWAHNLREYFPELLP